MSRDSLFLLDLFIGFMGFVTTGQLVCGILAFCFMYFATLGIPEWMIPKRKTDDITEVEPWRVSESFLGVPDYRMAKALREGVFREYIEKDPEKYKDSRARQKIQIGLNYKTENNCAASLEDEDADRIFIEFYEKYIVEHPEYETKEYNRMLGNYQLERILKKIYKEFSTPEEIKAAKWDACKEILSNLDKYKITCPSLLAWEMNRYYDPSAEELPIKYEISEKEYKILFDDFVAKGIVKKDTP